MSILVAVRARFRALPTWAQKGSLDIVRSALAAVVTFTFIAPADVAAAKQLGVALAIAVTYAVGRAILRLLNRALVALTEAEDAYGDA